MAVRGALTRACGALAALLAAALPIGCGEEEQAAEPGGGGGEPRVATVAEGLEVPWEIAFLPEGGALVTERPGRVRVLSEGGELRREPLARISVRELGEGGLLGLAVDPNFEDNRFVYLYRTVSAGNEIARYRLEGGRLSEQEVIVEGIPAGAVHNGGRMHFGPDERLYVATGDAGEQALAQEEDSLAGKFLRLGPDDYRGEGGRPERFTLGHRNPQGFDWAPGTDRLVATEHGAAANDEVNVIVRGENYGWPEVEGKEHGPFRAPLRLYADTTIAPSGATFVSQGGSAWTGDFVIAGLRGEQLRRLSFEGDEVTADEALLEGDHGRLRTVVEGPDGSLYALTSNRDGRGEPREGDDRILRIVPPQE